MPANMENSAVATGLEKSVFIPIPRKAMPKNIQTTAQFHSSHTIVKQCSKFSKLGFNSTWTMKFHMFKLDLEKAEEPEIKLPTSTGSSKKSKRIPETSISALLTMPKPLTVWITTNWKILKEREYQTTWPASWEIFMQVRKQELELDMEQQFSSVAQLCPTLCDPMNHSMPGLPVHHQLLESTQTHVHWVGDAIQPSHPLSSPSSTAFSVSRHQGLY